METSSPSIIDRQHRDRIRSRACKALSHDRFLLNTVAADMMDRLQDFRQKSNDIALLDDFLGVLTQATHQNRIVTTEADAVLGLFCLDQAPSIPEIFQQAHQTLRPDGLLILTTFGPRTLEAFKAAVYHMDMIHDQGAGLRFMPSISAVDLARLAISAGFKNPVIDAHTYTATYAHVLPLVHDLRAMGMGNVLRDRCKRSLTKSRLLTLMQHYPPNDQGRFVAPFEVFCLLAHR